MDALPPAALPDPPAETQYAAGDIYPRGSHEADLCATASHPDWLYLGGLVALDTLAIWQGSSTTFTYSDSLPVRLAGPAMIGLTWGATVGGAWLALPKCSGHFVSQTPPEGQVRETWPLALSFALLAGATAPIVNAIAIGYQAPPLPTTFEREMHLVSAGVAGFAGALLPYLIPPRTWSAARQLDRIRFGADGRGYAFIGYKAAF